MSAEDNRPAPGATPLPKDEPAHFSLEPIPEPAARPGRPIAESARGRLGSLEALEDHRCPHCKASMAEHQLVCFKCGFDQVRGVIVTPETGEAEAPPSTEAAAEYVPDGRVPVKVLVAIGVALTIGALVMRGVYAPPKATTSVVVALIALVLYQIVVHTATGVGAVAIAAKLSHQRFTRIELASVRMLIAFAAFQLVRFFQIPGAPNWVSGVLTLIVAAGVYFTLVMVQFRKLPNQASLIGVIHAGLWIVLEVGQVVASWAAGELAILDKA
jgi:hypothetical protein